MRALGYARVSTQEQATGGISLAVQRRKIEAQAEISDLELLGVVEDAGVSAKTAKRPGLLVLMERVEARETDVVIIGKLDRLARSIVDLNGIVDTLHAHNVGLISIADPIDTTSANGRLHMNILSALSQWERETISERTREALGELRAQGKRAGELPYGYGTDGEGYLVPAPGEQATLAAIRQLRDERLSWAAVAYRLTQDGHSTRRGTPFSRQGLHRLARAAGIQ